MERGARPIPNKLSLHRRLRGYKQKEVARLSGLYDASSLRQWEQGIAKYPEPHEVEHPVPQLYNELYADYFFELKKSLDAMELHLFEAV